MRPRTIQAGVWLAAIASLALWYVLARAALALADVGTRGLASALDALLATPAHPLAALAPALPTLNTLVDAFIWTLWLLGSLGLVLAAGYAAWMLRQGAAAGHRPVRAHELPNDVLP